MSKLKFPHASGNSMSIAAPATNPASDLELKLPSTVGSANQLLKNSGTAGTLEFSSNLTFDGSTLKTTASTDAALKITAGNASSQSRILFEDSAAVDGVITYDHNDRLLHIGAGTSTATDGDLVIDSSGKVGIGTSSPSSLLHVSGASGVPGLTAENTANSGEAAIYLKGKHSNGTVRQLMLKYDNSDRFRIHTAGSLPIAFETEDAERARISGGYLYVGITSEPGQGNDGCRFGGGGYHIVARDTATSGVFRAFGGNGEFRVVGSGDCVNTNNSYGSLSDQTLKQDIVDASSQWNDIKQVKVRKFRFKDKPTDPLQIGVVAQELETISPGLVEDNPDELYTATDELPEGKNVGDVKEKGYKSVKYSVLYMKAVKALQEAMAKIETLETKVAALEAK